MFQLAIEKALNHMINTNSINTDRLNNKLVAIRVNDIDLKLFFMFSNSRIFVIENNGKEPVDVDISLNKTAFLSLFKGVSFEELIETDEIEINGSIKTAQQLADLMGVEPKPLDEDAVSIKRVAFIREDECIGCTKCIQACPVDAIIGAAKHMHTVIKSECTGCDFV